LLGSGRRGGAPRLGAAAPGGVAEAWSPADIAPDFALVSAGLNLCHDPAVLTDGDGLLLSLNRAYRERFPDRSASRLRSARGEEASAALRQAQALGLRDGEAACRTVDRRRPAVKVSVERVGQGRDLLLWRFPRPRRSPIDVLASRIAGLEGEVLGEAGVLAAVVDADGQVIAANPLVRRAAPRGLGGWPGSTRCSRAQGGAGAPAAEGGRPAAAPAPHPRRPSSGQPAGLALLFATGETPGLAEPASLQACSTFFRSALPWSTGTAAS
jgi:two-component system cell cycle sensor histidine kinase/response regulator CckA